MTNTINNIPKHKAQEQEDLKAKIKEYEAENGPVKTVPIEVRDVGEKASESLKKQLGVIGNGG